MVLIRSHRQIPWNFANDPVSVNLHLYAKWIKDDTVSKYLDVKTDDWFFADVEYVSANGLMDGVGNELFAPYQNTSRAMIVTILYRLEGTPGGEDASFADVADGQWYSDAVGWAAANGIVTGYENGNVTIDQAGTSVTLEKQEVALVRLRVEF